jgi:hypothetical protein
MKIKFLIIIVALLSTKSYAVEVAKQDWLIAMKSALPAAFCNSPMYFRQCFNVTAEQCEETAISATRICLKNNETNIPNILIQPQDGTHWGTVIGTCAGEAYEVALIKQKISNPKCSDATNWQ